MLRQWSPCFLVLLMLFAWHYTTHCPSSTAPVLHIGHYAMPVVTWWSTQVLRILESFFFALRRFYLHYVLLFQGFPATSSSTSRLVGFHADLQIIAPGQPFVWITAICKRFRCGGFYLRARADQSQNINLHG